MHRHTHEPLVWYVGCFLSLLVTGISEYFCRAALIGWGCYSPASGEKKVIVACVACACPLVHTCCSVIALGSGKTNPWWTFLLLSFVFLFFFSGKGGRSTTHFFVSYYSCLAWTSWFFARSCRLGKGDFSPVLLALVCICFLRVHQFLQAWPAQNSIPERGWGSGFLARYTEAPPVGVA